MTTESHVSFMKEGKHPGDDKTSRLSADMFLSL